MAVVVAGVGAFYLVVPGLGKFGKLAAVGMWACQTVGMRGRAAFDSGLDRKWRRDYWGVVLDAPDPIGLAEFYSKLLGWEIASRSEDGAALLPPDGVGYLGTQLAADFEPPTWPTEPGRQRMLVHLDFEVVALDEAVAHAIELGATEAQFQPQDNVRVMLDPAGHPFCLYTDA